MHQERPIRPEDAQHLADQLREAFGSAERQVTVIFAGKPMRLERVSATEFELWAPGESTAARVVLTTEAGATDYPPAVPQLPSEIVMFAGAGAKLTATWWSRTKPDELLAEVHRQTVASGWAPQLEQSIAGTSNILRTYRKNGVFRSVVSGQGILSLTQ